MSKYSYTTFSFICLNNLALLSVFCQKKILKVHYDSQMLIFIQMFPAENFATLIRKLVCTAKASMPKSQQQLTFPH